MTSREQLHYILENGTDNQIELLVTLLLLEQCAESFQDDPPAKNQ